MNIKIDQKRVQVLLDLIKSATPQNPVKLFTDSGTFAPSSPLPVYEGEGIQ